MNSVQWIGKTDTPRLNWGPNGEGSSTMMQEALGSITPEARSILFRREFSLQAHPVRAIITVCGLGFFELTLDGRKVGDYVLSPLETSYRKRVLYDEFDITDLLSPGAHAIGVELGNGRYSTPDKYWDWRAGWHGDPCLALKLHIRYADGSEETISTGSDWKCAYGPVVSNCYYDGETFDANLLMPGWNTSGFDDSLWDAALCVCAPGGRMELNDFFHIRKMRTLKPARLIPQSDGSTVYDFGENISGWTKITVKGSQGAAVRIRYAERIKDGALDASSNRNAANTDTYILNGAAVQEYEPRFTLHGFSAAEVSVSGGQAEIIDIEAYHVYAALDKTGDFRCDNEDINRLHDVILRTQKSALLSFPMDCPQRDERLGWLGDAHVTDLTCLYNLDMNAFYRKWLGDVKANAHTETGAISFISPWHTFGHAADWSAAYAIVLWDHYLFHQDKDLLAEHCDALIRYVEFLGQSGPILDKTRYGDWMSVAEGWVRGDPACCTTLYYYYNLILLIRILSVLGRDEEKARFEAIALAEKQAILDRFYDPAAKSFDADTQFCLSFALKLGLIPEADEEAVLDRLVSDIEAHGNHLTTGILGTKYVMEALASHGKYQTAMNLILQKTYPGWLDLIKGRTTLAEDWKGGGSQNHCMFGCVDAIFYSTLAGIQVDEEITINPCFPKELSQVNARTRIRGGNISVSWTRLADEIHLILDISGPVSVIWRGDRLGAGHYEFIL